MGKEVVRAKAKFQRKLTSGTLFTFLLAYFSHNRLLERPLCTTYAISTILVTLIMYTLLKFNTIKIVKPYAE